jgi:hypothetical protein
MDEWKWNGLSRSGEGGEGYDDYEGLCLITCFTEGYLDTCEIWLWNASHSNYNSFSS